MSYAESFNLPFIFVQLSSDIRQPDPPVYFHKGEKSLHLDYFESLGCVK